MLALLSMACATFTWAETKSPAGTPAQIIVTIGHHYGHEPPVLTPEDLTVTQHYEPMVITSFVPLRGNRAGLELFVLVDSCSSCDPGSRFDELNRFISSQPGTVAVGVASIEGGRLRIIENPTQDHDRAVKALSAPAGSKPSNPFVPLTDLIRAWPQTSSRRAVVMISNGIDPTATDEIQDPSADRAIEAAQRAGVTVYAIYHPSADYLTHDYSELYSGQVRLAHVADETGGECYFLGFGPLPSLGPFLSDITDHLGNQYLLEFLANPDATGALQGVTVKSKTGDMELMMPGRVWVPAARPGSKKDRP